jgi:TfoX/Sxy family transcriptional regulator of competence genes
MAAYSNALTARVRQTLGARSDVVEKPMFGGLTFMVAGNMSCGVLKEELMIRLAAETTIASLESPHVRVCDFTKRPMRGLFLVSAEGCANQRSVDRWVGLALKHALSLPPK